MTSMVRVPVSVLPTGSSVHIKDSVDAVLRAQVDDTIKVLEARGLQDTRIHVIYDPVNKGHRG